jgi:hypothetical protein
VSPNVSKLSGERSESAAAPCSFIAQHSGSPRYALADSAGARGEDAGTDRRGRVRGRVSIHHGSCGGPRRGDQPCPGVLLERLSPNVLRLSGERPPAGRTRVRCSRGFGESWLMRRDIAGRYAMAEMLFNVSGIAPPETVETEGPGRSCGEISAGAGQDETGARCGCGPRRGWLSARPLTFLASRRTACGSAAPKASAAAAG